MDGNGEITYGEQTLEDHGDLKRIGNTLPNFEYGFSVALTYKDFDFSTFFQGIGSRDVWAVGQTGIPGFMPGEGWLEHQMDYWTPENKNASHPRLTWDDPNRNTRAESDRYLENGSYLRLRSVQLGYTFPQTWFKGAIQHARVYINAENLFTITSYSGYSPDVNADNANYRGFDNFIYPTNRTFMLGLNVTF